MSKSQYDYLLPVFVGHPFQSDYTEALRRSVTDACEFANESQQSSGKRFLWVPRFVHRLETGTLETVLQAVRDEISQSAIAIFEVSDATRANVFLELGMAIGMNRSITLLGQRPYDPPADLKGFRGIEYGDHADLESQLKVLLQSRLDELRRPPSPEQDLVFQKLQIDASWEGYIRSVSGGIHFFAGDVSWANDRRQAITDCVNRDVTVRVCCKRPADDEETKWNNIATLVESGAKVRLFPSHLDPSVRGFIVEPAKSDEAEAIFVEKSRRQGSRYTSSGAGVTVGESEFLYKAQLFRGNTQPKLVTAMTRLFDTLWHSNDVQAFRAKS